MHYNSFSSNIVLGILRRLDNLIILCVKVELKLLYLLKANNAVLASYVNYNKGAVLELTTINLYVETNIGINRGLNTVSKPFNYNLE